MVSDLIRREDAINAICEGCTAHTDYECAECGVGEFFRRIANIKTVDAVEVRHGCWEEQEYGTGDSVYVCSECHAEWVLNDGNPAENNMNYCPECGAKMDGGEKDA